MPRAHELVERIASPEEELARCRREALRDALTGVLNRRGWEAALPIEQGRCERHGLDAIVAAADLDDFKQLNDEQGHHAGDERLRRCAAVLRESVRGSDQVARPGGDEFAILAVHTRPESTEAVCEHLTWVLAPAGIAATVGAAARSEAGSLVDAWRLADTQMLTLERERRNDR